MPGVVSYQRKQEKLLNFADLESLIENFSLWKTVVIPNNLDFFFRERVYGPIYTGTAYACHFLELSPVRAFAIHVADLQRTF